jgi:hypothetical protein
MNPGHAGKREDDERRQDNRYEVHVSSPLIPERYGALRDNIPEIRST